MLLATQSTRLSHALGALVGGAIGDALGMPTQLLSRQMIANRYGLITEFMAPAEDHPVARGLPPGAVTDDTEQTLLLAHALVSEGEFDHLRWIATLLRWEDDVRARGSFDLLGPSTKRAIAAIRAGASVEIAGRFGDTNGAAMRIAPVGIMMPPSPLRPLVARVAETCRATHNTNVAIAAAAAVAAAVSAGVQGADWSEAAGVAIEAARLGGREGNWIAGADIAARIAWARALVRSRTETEAIGLVADLVGTSVASQESVPAAFALVAIAQGDPWACATLAANIGGDTDTIGAIAAGMAGACAGVGALPAEKIAQLRGFDLAEATNLAERLLARREPGR